MSSVTVIDTKRGLRPHAFDRAGSGVHDAAAAATR